MKTLVALLVLSSAFVVEDAAAQDYDDLDDTGRKKKEKKAKKKKDDAGKAAERRALLEAEIIREIERGYYAKAMVGATSYLATMSGIIRTGTALSLAVGNDFMDTENSSMAWEVAFYQGIHNGMHFEQQGMLLNQGGMDPGQLVQGDTHAFGLLVNGEYSTYPNRRFGIGARAGAGILLTPLLMQGDYYRDDVVNGEWNGYNPTVHSQPHPVFFAGPTIEYYTKLSHFSVGADVDVSYAIGIDLGLSAQGYLKYTF